LTFPGRAGQHSSFQWFWWCFDGLDHNATTGRNDKLYRLKDSGFETEVSHELGNFEFLLANDVDMSNAFVRGELLYFGRWFFDQLGIDGFRLDACKHIRSSWFPEWLSHVRAHAGRNLFAVGEYWSPSVDELHGYLAKTGGTLSLFDVPLHYKFHCASRSGSSFDLRTLFARTLVAEQPALAVTFVDNHDTQPHESLFSPVEPWFKPHAYAAILLRAGGYPCVFYPDYYGATYANTLGGPDVQLYSHRFLIDCFLQARHSHSHGDQHDYFEHPNRIGWFRSGNAAHPGSMAVVMSNAEASSLWMNTFRAGAVFRDATGHISQAVTANADGWAEFPCPAGNVSVWLS
jgi:alpha-amylase